MEYHRKQAKAFVRAYRAGDRDAIARAEAVLGARARDRFLLSDAQHVVAREQEHRSWRKLKQAHQRHSAQDNVEDRIVSTGLAYTPGEPADVHIRKRGWRFDVSDDARAVELAGRAPGWLEAAERVVAEFALNVNRRGVVFVQCNESRLDPLVARVAECSVALYQELIERA
jgi:hypothetical protein